MLWAYWLILGWFGFGWFDGVVCVCFGLVGLMVLFVFVLGWLVCGLIWVFAGCCSCGSGCVNLAICLSVFALLLLFVCR